MSRESFVISCIRRLREYGEGIVLADQCISTLKDVVKSNTYITIGMSQIGQKDRREMVNVLGLNSDQAQIVNLLDVGQGIIRLGGRFPFPQLIEFPLVQPKNLSESEIDKLNKEDQRVRDLLRKVNHVSDSEKNQQVSSQSIPQYTLSKMPEHKPDQMLERSKDILLDIFNRFDISSTARARDFGLSASASNKIFKYIEQKQLVDVVRINLAGGRGKTSKYFVLTNPKGYSAISKNPTKKSGGTGATHFFIERYLKKHLSRKGFSSVEVEKNIDGKRIDIVAIYDGLKIGIEICVSTIKTEYINIKKNEGKCDLLIIVTPDKKTKAKLDGELMKKAELGEKVKTCVVHELLNHPKKLIT